MQPVTSWLKITWYEPVAFLCADVAPLLRTRLPTESTDAQNAAAAAPAGPDGPCGPGAPAGPDVLAAAERSAGWIVPFAIFAILTALPAIFAVATALLASFDALTALFLIFGVVTALLLSLRRADAVRRQLIDGRDARSAERDEQRDGGDDHRRGRPMVTEESPEVAHG